MVTQFNSNELKKYLVESSPYLIIERKNYPINSIIKKQKIILDNLSHHEVLFKIGEFEKVDIVFVPNEKNDILEIECYNEQYENDDTIKIIKNKERINISPGGDSLVPGKYLIKLKRKQKIYELLYEIISSNTKTDNTKIMREYIDRHFENLSKNKNSKVLVTDKKCLSPIISNIINNPITNISKDRFNKKIITTDNIENKNLKTILISLKNSNEYKDNYFDFFLEQTWLKDIKASKIIKPTIRFIKDINYGKIYEEYNISSKDKKLPYKKNSSLFEIYSFLIIKEAIESIGFKWVSGWLKDSDNLSDIKKGELLVFKKENKKIKLFFEKSLLISNDLVLKKDETSQVSSPIDIKCKTPDILIEFYKNDNFIDSMIVEVKYRKQIYIDKLYQDMSNQLLSYRRMDFYDSKVKKVIDKKAVKKILLIYPMQESEKEEHRIYEDIMFLPIDFKNPIEDILIEIKYLLNEIDTINDLFVASTV